MDWNGDEYLRRVEEIIGNRVRVSGEIFAEQVQENIGVQGTRQNPSKPGEFPHRVTGQTQASIATDYDPPNLTSMIGSTSKVARFLEKGTVNMDERPFLVRTLRQESNNIARFILGPDFGPGN